MDIETFRDYCLGKKGTTESFPFPNVPNDLIFKVAGKMFAISDITVFDSITLRCDPETIDDLRERYPALRQPAYYSDRKWSRILINESISDQQLYQWIDASYAIAVSMLTKKAQREL